MVREELARIKEKLRAQRFAGAAHRVSFAAQCGSIVFSRRFL
jgi:hypothetical protein